MITFFTTLAWIFGTAATLLFILRVAAALNYTDMMKLQDSLAGKERTFPVIWPLIIMLVSFAWIFSV